MSRGLEPSRRARSIKPTLIRALRAGMGPGTIDFGLGQTDLAIGEAVRRRLQEQLQGQTRTPYTPNAGLWEARQAVADHVGASSDEIMLTCGVQEGLAVAILGLCDPGDRALVPDPGFPAYANLVRAAGAEPIAYPLAPPTTEDPGWKLDPGAIADAIDDRTRLVILNNPTNPCGSVHDIGALQEVLDLLAERQIPWVSDEIYEDYVWRGQFASAWNLQPGEPSGIALSGLSKSHHLMGWRMGWMVAPQETIRHLTPLHQHLVTCAPRPAQQAVIPALKNHEVALAKTRSIFADRRRLTLEILSELQLGSPPAAQGAFYLFVDVRPWLSSFETTAAMAQALLDEEDVLVIPGEGFGDCGLGHLRVAYTIGGDELERGLICLRDFLQRHRPTGDAA